MFTARGDVFTVPAKEGSIRNLTRTPGVREKYAAWSPDGRWIAYMSDRTGEDEIYIAPQDGLGQEQQITSDGKMFRLPPPWVAGQQEIAFADKEPALCYVDINDKKPVLSRPGQVWRHRPNYNWSPDSKWVAYDKNGRESAMASSICMSLADRKITPVTTTLNNSLARSSIPRGSISTSFPIATSTKCWAIYDFEFANPKTTRVYVVTLRADEPSPFPAAERRGDGEARRRRLSTPPGAQAASTETPTRSRSPARNEARSPTTEKRKRQRREPRSLPRISASTSTAFRDRIVALPIPPAHHAQSARRPRM